MNQTITPTADGFDVQLSGRFTFNDYQAFRDLMYKFNAKKNCRIVFNLKSVDFIDSSALGMLLIAHEEVKKVGGSIVIREPHGQVRRTLEIASMSSMFPIEL